jgi:putative transposase
MKRRSFSEEKILQILKESEGKTIASICRQYGVTAVTFYRWRTKYEGLKLKEIKKIREMEEENRKLKRIIADMSLDIHGLKEIIKKKI